MQVRKAALGGLRRFYPTVKVLRPYMDEEAGDQSHDPPNESHIKILS